MIACPCCGLPNEVGAALDKSGALERARVVGVLDAWAKGSKSLGWECCDCDKQTCCTLEITENGGATRTIEYYGATPDAARAAAAKAIEAGEV